MEKQLTIFDVFAEMDKKQEGTTIYQDCLDADYFFEPSKGNKRGEMYVVCIHTKKKLFLVTIKLSNQGLINFSYSALDGYWKGTHMTSDINEVKKSIRNLVDDERTDLQIKKPL